MKSTTYFTELTNQKAENICLLEKNLNPLSCLPACLKSIKKFST